MICPKCYGKTYVYDTRPRSDENIRRRRSCTECGYKFTTVECLSQIFDKDYTQKSYEYCFLFEEYTNQNCKKCPFRKRCLTEEEVYEVS